MSNRAFKKLKVKEHNEKYERKKIENDVVITGTRLTLADLKSTTALLNSRPYDNH